MIPGITNRPVPSIAFASGGAFTFAPTSLILPSSIQMEPLRMVPPVTVRTVAFRITKLFSAGSGTGGRRDGIGEAVVDGGLAAPGDTGAGSSGTGFAPLTAGAGAAEEESTGRRSS